MQLNEKDLARMPQDFSAQLKMAVPGTNITVSNTPCNIPDGFLLVYGGIDVNCTLLRCLRPPETHCRTLRSACSFAEPPAEKVV